MLPKHSSDVMNTIMALAAQPNGRADRANGKGESALEMDIINVSDDLGRPISVLIVDDESVYRHALINSLGRTPELARSLKISQADGSGQAIGALGDNSFDLIITDIDMGPESMDGIELVGV